MAGFGEKLRTGGTGWGSRLSLAMLVGSLVLLVAGPWAEPRAQTAQTKAVPETTGEIELSFAAVVRQAAPAVVNIYTRRVVRSGIASPLLKDPLLRHFFGEGFGFGMPRERVQASLGSGVIVRPDGFLVTNYHVIQDSDEITVVLADRREFGATILRTDERTDLAVLKIDTGGEELPFLELRDSDELEVGDLVLAIGNPFGIGQAVTSGIVSALARTQVGITDFRFFIQTDAAINPGNSGGALVSMDGRLAGINTAIFSRTGGSLGIGFAIPSNMVATVIAGVTSGGRLVRPWLGASGQSVTADIAESLGLARPGGVIIARVYPGGPADGAGLEVGDVVTAVNGREVEDSEALRFRIATLPIGGGATLALHRRGSDRTVTVLLEAPPEDPPRQETMLRGAHPLSGATVANLSPALADELALDLFARGVVILDTARGSPAQRFFATGDILLRIAGLETETVDALERALMQPARVWNIALRRGGKVVNLAVSG